MRPLVATAICLMLVCRLAAQTVPNVDPQTILAGLRDIKAKVAKASTAQLATTITDFTNAASSNESAIAFYTEAVRVTEFVGRPNEAGAFADWQKTEGPRLNGPAIQTALRYTTISLQRAMGATDKQIFPVLLAYVESIPDITPVVPPGQQPGQQRQRGMRGQERGQGRGQGQGGPGGEGGQGLGSIYGNASEDIVNVPVAENIFAKWYNVTEQLSGAKNWVMVPLDTDGMWDQVLLPYMRQTRDPQLITYWDNKIATETAAASTAAAAFSTDRFNQTRRPELLWDRAEDRIVLGDRQRALSEMYSIVKSFPDHPSAAKWIAELETLVTNGTSAPATGTSVPTTGTQGTAAAP